VSWVIEEDPTGDPAARVAAFRQVGDDKEAPGSAVLVEERGVAGYDGFLTYTRGSRRPSATWSFEGWSPDPAHKLAHLRITAHAGPAATAAYDELDPLAVLLATRPRMDRPVARWTWPTRDEHERWWRMEREYAALADDAATVGRWLEAGRQLTFGPPTLPMMGELLRGTRSPDVGALLTARLILASEGDVDGFETSTRFLSVLGEWDRQAAAVETVWLLHHALARAKRTTDGTALRWWRLALQLAERRQTDGDVRGIGEVAMAVTEREGTFLCEHLEKVFGSSRALVEHPVLAPSLARCLDPAGMPAQADHVGLGRFASWYLDLPALRRFYLTMLAREDRWGEVEITEEGAVIHTPVRDRSCGIPANLPSTGTRFPLRLGDAYACGAADRAREVLFYGWDPDGKRRAARQALAGRIVARYGAP
jgi:hypothetical protein